MKKIFFLFMILMIPFLSINLFEKEEYKVEKEEEYERVEYVDDKIKDITRQKQFSEGSIKEREKIAKDLLSELEEDGYIKDLYYDGRSCVFSFKYSNGMLGGFKINDFREGINGIEIG